MKCLNKILICMLSIMMLLNTGIVNIQADNINIIKQGDKDTFFDKMPVNDLTTFIDISKINKNNYTWESTIENVEEITHNSSKILAIKNPLSNGGEYNSNGTLSLTFTDAFLNSDGSRSDLVLELSNIYIKQLTDNPQVSYYGIITDGKTLNTNAFSEDIKGFTGDTQNVDPLYIYAAQRTNRSVNFKIYKKDSTSDKFVFGILDLDVGDYTNSGGTADYNGEYVESIEAISGYGDVYMPATNILQRDGNKMRAYATDDNTWDTGFVTTFSSNNESKWRASGRNTNTNLFENLPYYTVKDSVVGGGEIKYKPTSGEKDQGTIVSGKGGDVTIVTRPLEGHKIKKITIDGEDATPEDKTSEFEYTFSNIKDNHEIIAEYEPFTYKINYDGNGGQGDMPSQDFTFDDEVFNSKENAFTKEGSKFLGFKIEGRDELITSPEDFRALLVSMGDGAEITLVAQWEEIKYDVTFVDGFGNTLKTESVKLHESATAPTNPTKAGYTFSGWDVKYDDITDNLTVTAKWNPVQRNNAVHREVVNTAAK